MVGMIALQSSGTLDYRNAIDQIGTVYSTVSAADSSPGQVEVVGTRPFITAEAFTSHHGTAQARRQSPRHRLIGTSTLQVEPL